MEPLLSTHRPAFAHCGQHLRPVILVVDDEQGVHESCHVLLDDQYDLLGALDGPTALKMMDSHRVDLVLLDLRLPGVEGIKVLAKIHETKPQINVIVVTAVMSVRSAVEAMKVGAFHYLTKPFNGEEVCSLIKAALASYGDAALVLRRPLSDATNVRGACVLFVGSELGPLVTLKLALERYVAANVAVNTTLALRSHVCFGGLPGSALAIIVATSRAPTRRSIPGSPMEVSKHECLRGQWIL